MAHFFVSHSHEDKEFVQELKRQMKAVGLLPWTDEDIVPGEEWSPAIDAALQECAGIIVVISPAALKSMWVTYEWSFGMGLGKNITTLLLAGSDPASNPQFHKKLADLQYMDFRNNTYRWGALIAHLRDVHDIGNVPAPVRTAVELLNSAKDEDIKQGIERLSQIALPSASEALATACRHPTPLVRQQAGFALAQKTQHQDKRALAGLASAVESPSSTVRARAVKELAMFPDLAGVPYLEQILDSDPDNHVLVSAARALGNIGSMDSTAILKKALNTQYSAVCE